MSDEFICQFSGESYIGPCPITKCPANIANLKNRGNSGCVFNFLSKKELSVYDLSYIYSKPVKDIGQTVERMENKIQNTILLYNILTRIKQNNRIDKFCSNCGILRNSQGDCLNTQLCNDRKETVKKILKCYPSELKMDSKDVFLLLSNLKNLKTFLDKRNETKSIPIKIRHLLNLTKQQYRAFRSLRAIV